MIQRPIARRLAALVIADLVCVLAALWLSPVLYPMLKHGKFVSIGYLHSPVWQLCVVVQIYLFYLAGLYDTEDSWSRMLALTRIAIASGGMTMILLLAYFFQRRQSRGVILLYWPLAFLSVALTRTLIGRLRPAPQRNVILVCKGRPASMDIELVQSATCGDYLFKGIVVCNGHEAPPALDVPVTQIADPSELERIVKDEGISELVVGAGCDSHPELVRDLVLLSHRHVLLLDPITFFEQVTGKLPCEHLTDASYLFLIVPRKGVPYPKLRRLLDMGLAFFGIVVSFPFWILVAVAVKLSSKGPILVTEERVGLEGESFPLIKFRTDAGPADHSAEPIAMDHPSVTAVGRLLRRTRIDELPQLINVLRGEMSLIGPRPERSALVEQFEREIPYYQERHAVRPGITGWAQVNQGYVLGAEAAKEKLAYDLFYLKNQSFTLDLLIAFMTIRELLLGRGQ
ncbi:MAG: sugar transferase [Planctomycetota bacterium]